MPYRLAVRREARVRLRAERLVRRTVFLTGRREARFVARRLDLRAVVFFLAILSPPPERKEAACVLQSRDTASLGNALCISGDLVGGIIGTSFFTFQAGYRHYSDDPHG